jgi:hypothetical protein
MLGSVGAAGAFFASGALLSIGAEIFGGAESSLLEEHPVITRGISNIRMQGKKLRMGDVPLIVKSVQRHIIPH